MLVIYTGDGKGKTSAAVGTAVRAAGRNKKILFMQFVKGKEDSGEVGILSNLKNVVYRKYGAGFITEKNIEEHKGRAKEGWDYFKENIKSGDFDFFILDELNIALYYGLLYLKEVVSFLKNVNKSKFVVITGRKAPAELIKIADIVTDMTNVKHIFDKGVEAMEGLDY